MQIHNPIARVGFTPPSPSRLARRALFSKVAAVRGRLSLCADQAAAAKMVVEHARLQEIPARAQCQKLSPQGAPHPDDAGLQAQEASLSFALGLA